MKGFPPLSRGPRETRPSSSRVKTVQFELSDSEECIPLLSDQKLEKKACHIWDSQLRWNHETDIRTTVKTAIEDCLRSASLEDELGIDQEVPFPSVGKKSDRTDLAVAKTKSKYENISCAIEVKKPPNDEHERKGIEYDMDDVQQLVQYMYDLRSAFGLRFVFGILTTYRKWRFFWFKDSDEAMKCDNIESFERLCAPSPTTSTLLFLDGGNFIV